MTKKILIPVANPEFSLQILPTIKQFFAPEDSELLLLHVEPEPHLIEIQRPGENDYVYVDQQVASLRVDFQSKMLPLVRSLEYDGYKVATRVKIGDTDEEIDELVSSEEIDLVAMTTHGRRGLDRLLHGSVAEHVLRHSSVPVLLLHPVDERNE